MKNKEVIPTVRENLHQEHRLECPFAEIRESAIIGEKSLYALRSFSPGDSLIRFQTKGYLAEPDRFTVQLAENRHIILDPEYLQYVNHSCRPNVFFDLRNKAIICLRPISRNEEITFFYPSTEWSLSHDFTCRCGSPSCLGHIRGARYLSSDILTRYRLSDFIHHKHLDKNR